MESERRQKRDDLAKLEKRLSSCKSVLEAPGLSPCVRAEMGLERQLLRQEIEETKLCIQDLDKRIGK